MGTEAPLSGRTATHITFVSMLHAHPTHVSAAYRIVEGMLMVPDPDAVAGRKAPADAADGSDAPGTGGQAPARSDG